MAHTSLSIQKKETNIMICKDRIDVKDVAEMRPTIS